MLPACRSCNHYKSTLDLEQFREAIENMPAVLTRDNATFKNAVRFKVVDVTHKPVVFFFESFGVKL